MIIINLLFGVGIFDYEKTLSVSALSFRLVHGYFLDVDAINVQQFGGSSPTFAIGNLYYSPPFSILLNLCLFVLILVFFKRFIPNQKIYCENKLSFALIVFYFYVVVMPFFSDPIGIISSPFQLSPLLALFVLKSRSRLRN